MFLIDDKYIKKSISIYKATRSAITLKEINEHLSRYIYNYPRKAFGVNHESALDFYCYYMERIENIILKYNETEVKFITWFTYTLRNSYLNYADYKKRKEKYNNVEEISIDAPLCNREAYTLHDVLYDTKTYSLSDYVDDTDDIENISLKMFDYIESIFNDRDSLTFFMHNLELFINLVSKPLMNYFNISYEEAYSIIEKARATYIHKYNDIIKLQDSIASINLQIAENNRKGIFTIHLASKKQQRIKKLQSIKVTVSYDFLSKLFDITVNAVTKIIKKIKTQLKESFKL
ncbi:RNA polymerase subunit sigma [Brachyspira pilosicoli]|uniref:RNA polymerase subunit sigma n=1 Tax=Brachyspira pilosicoli TaxID=52584 RepID=UPI001CA5DC0E|nr:RNA polymerase subunit sigma [Brachyspira pilosicoli]MBW5397839.1 RNA polymerase subunit sigma [Brachyspira pilosicoli]